MIHSRIHRQRGFTMVESLVALVVLSVGLLGIASLYVTSLRTGRTAMIRTQAVTLVGDMADRIRANGRAGDAYDTTAYGGAPEAQGCVVDANCTAEALAEDDLASWIEAVNAALPAPVATVTFTPAAGGVGRPDQYTIDVAWNEAGEAFNYTSNIMLIPVTP
ncbi:MAG: type IV pilus modification protein PilV [Steroidobacteraceae bacterium]|nr:type IV pilus modification protein PilV [Steroidobacteraceae bacterium]MCW5571757.1 type IV pilus modification protein PilV [Steroidobacteraceae bacterium]